MLCVASLIVLGILSLFSARYRDPAKEALDCVFRRVTLRPCTTGFDTKVRSSITSSLLLRSPKLARFFNQRFELISWFFVLTFFVSFFWSARSVYLFWSTGSCNGLNQSGFCAFDPSGKNNTVSGMGEECQLGGAVANSLTLSGVNLDQFPSMKGTSDKEMVFIGCYACKYTKQTYPLIKQLIEKYHPSVRFVFYSTHEEANYLMAYDYAVQKIAPEKYFKWVDALYLESHDMVASEGTTIQLINDLGIDTQAVEAIVKNPETKTITQLRKSEIDKTGIYGTPTVFMNGKPVVGPKPYRVYRQMLNKTWF
jgi:Thioredoxin